jgi:hypothetical protein
MGHAILASTFDGFTVRPLPAWLTRSLVPDAAGGSASSQTYRRGRAVQLEASASLIAGEGILIEELGWRWRCPGSGSGPARREPRPAGHDVAVQRVWCAP